MLDLQDTINFLTVSSLRLRVTESQELAVVGDPSKLTADVKAALVHHKTTLIALHKPDAYTEVCQYFDRKESHTRAIADPSFLGCCFCKSRDSLDDGERGIICTACDKYCWLDTRLGGLVRADEGFTEWDAPLEIDYSIIGRRWK